MKTKEQVEMARLRAQLDEAVALLRRLECRFGWRINRSGMGGSWVFKRGENINTDDSLDKDVTNTRAFLSRLSAKGGTR